MDSELCFNLSYFKRMPSVSSVTWIEHLKELRRVDDNILPRLNATNTHSDDDCKQFIVQLARAYQDRQDAIAHCTGLMDKEVQDKQAQLALDPDNSALKARLFTLTLQRRMIANETTVEDIVRERSLRVIHDRCRHIPIEPLKRH
jgi:hypothetical protein